MAQSVRMPGTTIAKDHDSQRDKSRISYFGNVKSRLGSKLPPGVSQPPLFAKKPWESQPKKDHWSQDQDQPMSRPLDHVPHIRNPKLRQYYLQGTSWDVNSAAVKHQDMEGASYDSTGITIDKLREEGSGCQSYPRNTMGKQSLFQSLYNKYNRKNIYSDFYSKGLPGDTVFTVTSQFNGTASSSLEEGKMGLRTPHFSSHLCSSDGDLFPRKGSSANIQGSSQPELDDPHIKQIMEPSSDTLDTVTTQPQSPLPESEYDKLLDVEAVPMPDGQLCLFALPPEFCEGEGPEAVQYLKLLCRYITDRKGVVSGILLVTSNKIFFDPCKTHPLVKEHGCEEYLLSCSVDNLMSVSFFSDISHVHFNTSLQRKKGKKILQQLKKQARGLLKQKEESVHSELSGLALSLTKEVSGEEEEADSRDMEEAEGELDGIPSNTATFCSGGQGTASMQHTVETKPSETAMQRKLSTCSAGGLMFVRLQFQLPSRKKRSPGALQIGPAKTSRQRDAWLALSQESSDELYAYLTHSRPDLCILEGGEEGEADREEEEFVLIKDKDEVEQEEEVEEEEEEVCHRLRNPGEDWEMVLMEDSREKLSLVLDRDPEGFSNILECSDILEASHVREISKELPPRTIGHTWNLAYSTSRHGASLKTLYRKLSASDSPVLIVIKDALDEIFGAFLSHPLRPSETFYGTGETFLFMLHPRYKCFRWTGENSFFIKGDLDSFAIGGGSGHFGLWVDENLYLGRSSPCFTFNNCCLSETDDFRIMDLEAWTFS